MQMLIKIDSTACFVSEQMKASFFIYSVVTFFFCCWLASGFLRGLPSPHPILILSFPDPQVGWSRTVLLSWLSFAPCGDEGSLTIESEWNLNTAEFFLNAQPQDLV